MSTVTRSSKPKTHLIKDVYIAYTRELLKSNPTWWGKYDKRTQNYYVYRHADVGGSDKVVEVINYSRFRTIIETWYKGAQKYITYGAVLSMGHNLGRIAARRVERNYANKQVDWQKTHDMWEKKGERKGLIYFLDEEWTRIGWKRAFKLKNQKVYRFTPAEGNRTNDMGFKKYFSKCNKEDASLKYRYEFFPYIMDKD